MSKHIAPEDRFKLCRGEIKPSEKEIARFWVKVDKQISPNGCWIWTSSKTARMLHGVFCFHGKNIYAHRFSWVIANGAIPKETPCVLHNCPEGDNPSCVNPSHLWLGTVVDNAKDRDAKGRQAFGDKNGSRTCPQNLKRGELHHSHKLTSEQVLEIKTRLRNGYRGIGTYLAVQFGVSRYVISQIKTGKSWHHLNLT